MLNLRSCSLGITLRYLCSGGASQKPYDAVHGKRQSGDHSEKMQFFNIYDIFSSHLLLLVCRLMMRQFFTTYHIWEMRYWNKMDPSSKNSSKTMMEKFMGKKVRYWTFYASCPCNAEVRFIMEVMGKVIAFLQDNMENLEKVFSIT